MNIHAFTDYLSIFIGFQAYLYFNKQSPLTQTQRYLYIIGALVGALIGSRVLALLSDPSLLSSGLSLQVVFANKTIIGALVGGILGIEITKKFLHITQKTGDGIVLPLMIAIMIGRIGCQLTGVSDGTIGVPCDFLWCFTQGDSYARHPLPLYEIFVLLTALPFAYHAYRKKLFPEGVLFRFFCIGYFSLRFLLEFLKSDPKSFLSLTVIQLVCAAVVVWYIFDCFTIYSHIKKQDSL